MSEVESLLMPSAAVQVADRQLRMLKSAFGIPINAALEDPDVIEITVNPDGKLWLDRLNSGRAHSDITLSAAATERIIRLVAAHIRTEVHASAPIISAELPDTGERFEGILPPIVRAPSFSIRKRAIRVIGLGSYVQESIMTAPQAEMLRHAVRDCQNILIAGGTSTGKTTLANALLAEMAESKARVILLEDTLELQCTAQDRLSLRTQAGVASMTQLVRSTLRMRPDRIIMGEVRGGEALDLLKAWGTGHPGGLATIHAGSARGALNRLEQLIQEVVTTVPRALIAEAINVIVFIAGRNRARRVEEIIRVTGLDAHGYHLEPLTCHSGDAAC